MVDGLLWLFVFVRTYLASSCISLYILGWDPDLFRCYLRFLNICERIIPKLKVHC